MKIKDGVSIRGLQPQMVLAAVIAEPILNKYDQECVITSGTDGTHSKGSRHYVGLAIDVRTWTLSNKQQCVKDLQDALSGEFDVVLESDHIHIEYDPL